MNNCSTKHLKLVGVIVGIVAVLISLSTVLGYTQREDLEGRIRALEVKLGQLEVKLEEGFKRAEAERAFIRTGLDDIRSRLPK